MRPMLVAVMVARYASTPKTNQSATGTGLSHAAPGHGRNRISSDAIAAATNRPRSMPSSMTRVSSSLVLWSTSLLVVTKRLSADRTRRSIVNRSVTVESHRHTAVRLHDGRDTQAAGKLLHGFSSLKVALNVDLGERDLARAHVIHGSRAIRAAG